MPAASARGTRARCGRARGSSTSRGAGRWMTGGTLLLAHRIAYSSDPGKRRPCPAGATIRGNPVGGRQHENRQRVAWIECDAAPSGRLVAAIFARDGKSYAVQIGTISGKEYRIYSDEMFFIQDPRQLYNFWPGDVWDAIAKHEVRPGMDELQADFAVGMGIPQRQEDAAIKTVDYPNG